MTCTGDIYTCNCGRCQYEAALQAYDEQLAEAGSSAFMLYGNADDANRVAHQLVQPPPTNPIIRTTALRAYPGWEVRQYADGTYDAADSCSPAISGGYETFREAVVWVRKQSARARAVYGSKKGNNETQS